MRGFGVTDKGKVRKENQDRFLIQVLEGRDSAVAVLCDGMGGAQAGSVASTMATEAFMTHALACLNQPSDTRDVSEIAVDAANYTNIKVYDRSFADFGCIGMGTTLVAAIVREQQTAIVNVGDSRCYLIADRQIRLLTRDHSLVEDLIDRGALTRDEAKSHPRKNVITRAMGVEQTVLCDVFTPKLKQGDILLLCSDGLSNLVSEEEILSAVKKKSKLETICANLMELALQRGAGDNVTVALLER